MAESNNTENMRVCAGACHCGSVRFEVTIPTRIKVSHCNCSVCKQTGFVHLIVPRSRFRLLAGESELVEYRFNTRIANHLFCRNCGIKSFYIPRSHPEDYSVNLNCVELHEGIEVRQSSFDGKNWRKNISGLLESDMLNEN